MSCDSKRVLSRDSMSNHKKVNQMLFSDCGRMTSITGALYGGTKLTKVTVNEISLHLVNLFPMCLVDIVYSKHVFLVFRTIRVIVARSLTVARSIVSHRATISVFAPSTLLEPA